MENFGQFEIRTLIGKNAPREKLASFLHERGLNMENDLEYSYLLMENSKIAATASLSGNMIKCVAVDEQYEGMGLAATVVGAVIEEAYTRGLTHLFLCTKPIYAMTFGGLGFRKLEEYPGRAIFLDNDPHGIDNYIELLRKSKKDGINGCIVMNANPFSNGHRYLVEKAAKECDYLHIFLVKEDKSEFPYDIRYKLVCEGTRDIQNVIIHEGGQYVLSADTFPSYFLKDTGEVAETYATIDAKIFADYIAPALGITKRFVGSEPLSETTLIYNNVLSTILPQEGIELIIYERKKIGGEPISASKVRELFKNKNYDEVKNLVPMSTYDFLISSDGDELRTKLEQDKR